MKLILFPNPALTVPCSPVEQFDWALWAQAGEMLEHVVKFGGYALAAPQVGIQKQLFVITDHSDLADQFGGLDYPRVLCNPTIVATTPSRVRMKESCLSIPGVSAWCDRYPSILCRYQNLEGKTFECEAMGLLAHVMQHEVDHLDGKLFVSQLNQYETGRIQKRLNKMRQRI